MREFTPSKRRILLLLIAIAIVSRCALALRTDERICTKPYIEDSFYAFKCAMHLAQGEGFTVDGLSATNGVQPLMVTLYAPIFALAGHDRWLALRWSFLLIGLIEGLSVLFIAKLIRSLMRREQDAPWWRYPPIVGALCWTFLAPIMAHSVNGLETGLYSMLILLTTWAYARINARRVELDDVPIGLWIGFGVLLGLLVLSRIDGSFLVVGFAFFELLSGFDKLSKARWRNAFIFCILALLVSSPWWLYNKMQFGSFMPISGHSEGVWGPKRDNYIRGAVALADVFTTFFYTPHYNLPWWYTDWAFATYSIIITLVVLFVIKKARVVAWISSAFHPATLTPLALASLGLLFYYVFIFGAPHFLPRYFQPIRILWTLLFAMSVPALYECVKSLKLRRPRMTQLVVGLVAIAAIAFNVGLYASFFTTHAISDLYLTGKWAAAMPTASIGMEQSATASFVSDNVVNLDGKVNFEALRYRVSGRIGEYIARKRFDYIADWIAFSGPLVYNAERAGVHYQPQDSIGSVVLFKRLP